MFDTWRANTWQCFRNHGQLFSDLVLEASDLGGQFRFEFGLEFSDQFRNLFLGFGDFASAFGMKIARAF